MTASKRFKIQCASPSDRETIYRIRHDVYAQELGQHTPTPGAALCDALDACNDYIVAKIGETIAGFISITPPDAERFSLDKYLPRKEWPVVPDNGLYEIRLLTVVEACRRRELAALLMYAAFRWVESRGGTHIVAIGRREIKSLYLKAGLRGSGQEIQSGKVHYEVLHGSVTSIRETFRQPILDRLAVCADWQLDFTFHKPSTCFHGGTFFSAIGEQFDALHRSECVINADVLDAWFPPSPKVIAALQEYLPWLLRTSPPNDASGLIATIAKVRNVPAASILPGAGSSDLIFRAFRHWLTPRSRVLILDPIYSEYPHILERVIGCNVERFELRRDENYDINLEALRSKISEGFDLAVLVNPNSPTGRHVSKDGMATLLREIPATTRVWIDETYIEYLGTDQSLEPFAARSRNVIVCKSMSKVYALSGIRAAYLCAPPHLLEDLRAITPPWAVSLPAQVAAVNALNDPAYYAGCYRQTHDYRRELHQELETLGWKIIPGCANFLLAHLPAAGPSASAVVEYCQRANVFLRNPANMGRSFGNRALRIAVKDRTSNQQIASVIREALLSHS